MLHHHSVGAAGATLLAALLGRTGWGLRALGHWRIVSVILIVVSVSLCTIDFRCSFLSAWALGGWGLQRNRYGEGF